MSKKWASKPALDENGKPILSAKGKPILKKSYSVLQDDFFRYMRDAGYDDMERGERGSSEEHLTVTQFKVQQEQARLAELTEQNRQQEQQAATLGKQIKKIQNQQVDVAAIEKIEAKPVPLSSKVILERSEYESLATAAKKYVASEKRNQVAKGFGCGKQADCKTQGRDRRFEAGAFRVQIRSQQAPYTRLGTRKRRASRKSATL